MVPAIVEISHLEAGGLIVWWHAMQAICAGGLYVVKLFLSPCSITRFIALRLFVV